ncbi:hypothetical protein HN709_02145 [Candidatus Peregrinibacteria bacterium]|nr:hypothetical protein [Candidatus Peregrinibacteria bacterium]MBT7736464.1 hypothetical protein [Candidatus Peregrinibacteria bacterium]
MAPEGPSEDIEFTHAEALVPLRAVRSEPINYSSVPPMDGGSPYKSFLNMPVAINPDRPDKGLLVTNSDGRTIGILIQSYRRAAQEFDYERSDAVNSPMNATNTRANGIVVAGANIFAMEEDLRNSLVGGRIVWIGMRQEDPEDRHEEMCVLIETRDGQRAYWIFPNALG